MIDKETGHISWEKGGQEIINLMRGLTPGPGAYTLYEGDRALHRRRSAVFRQERTMHVDTAVFRHIQNFLPKKSLWRARN